MKPDKLKLKRLERVKMMRGADLRLAQLRLGQVQNAFQRAQDQANAVSELVRTSGSDAGPIDPAFLKGAANLRGLLHNALSSARLRATQLSDSREEAARAMARADARHAKVERDVSSARVKAQDETEETERADVIHSPKSRLV